MVIEFLGEPFNAGFAGLSGIILDPRHDFRIRRYHFGRQAVDPLNIKFAIPDVIGVFLGTAIRIVQDQFCRTFVITRKTKDKRPIRVDGINRLSIKKDAGPGISLTKDNAALNELALIGRLGRQSPKRRGH